MPYNDKGEWWPTTLQKSWWARLKWKLFVKGWYTIGG